MAINHSGPFPPAGPPAYTTTPQGGVPPQHGPMPQGPGGSVRPATKGRNAVGIVAFVAAVLGFIFAVWEGAYLLGWLLLPVAFVLSLVALFLPNKGKKLAVAALIISIVGTISGVFAFLGSAARAVDDAFGGGEVTASAPVAQDGAGSSWEGSGSTDVGTRANPYPLGTAISSDEWTVTVNSFDPDATSEVRAENQFNEKPASGKAYALANVTVTYTGQDSGSPMGMDVSYVTSAGNTVHSHDVLAVIPDPISSNVLYPGASATGNVGLMIPKDDAGTLRIRPGVLADEVFVALR